MQSRLYHIPKLHSAQSGFIKKVSWLELFYDLVFVAAYVQLGNQLSKDVSVNGFLGFAAIFMVMWLIWTGFAFYCNRFVVDDALHRCLVLIQMIAIGGMAISGADALDDAGAIFSLSCATAMLTVTLMYLRSMKKPDLEGQYSRYWGGAFFISACLWAIGAAVPQPYSFWFWATGTVLLLLLPFSKASRATEERFPWDREHMGERYGLLTLIVLGESFVKMIGGAPSPVSFATLGPAAMTVALSASLWWIYFDDVANSHLKKMKFSQFIWLFSHLPLHLGITTVGISLKKSVWIDWSAPLPVGYRTILFGSFGLTIFATAMIDWVSERKISELSDRSRVRARFISAAIMFLVIPATSGLGVGMLLSILLAVCLAQVVFDMLMAPLEEEKLLMKNHEAEDEPSLGDDGADQRSLGSDKFRITNAIRKGIPNELRQDLYFFFMQGSWSRLLLSLGFSYIMINIVFAFLYLIEPNSIVNARPNSFADAFYFSIQTISTIGYGTLSPTTDYGNLIVTIESAVGLILTAVATGLMFAKASQPTSSILFSKSLIIQKRDGVPTLMFRAGNPRGHDLANAQMDLTILTDELTKEGEKMRRLTELKLERNRTPLFRLSWTVMHPIDEDSPLYPYDPEKVGEEFLALIATLTGHDSTYGETIYAGYSYYPDDLMPNCRFVDIIEQLPDGRASIDYGKFHQTEKFA